MKMIHLSDAAQAKIIEHCRNGHAIGMRVKVFAGGCSGLIYKFSLSGLTVEDEDNDVIVGAAGAALFVDKASAEKLDGATIDYVSELMSEQFVINNPNTDCCGCGKSFT